MSRFLSEALRGSLSHKTQKEGDNNFQDHAKCNSRGKSQSINHHSEESITMGKANHYMNA